MQSIEIDEYCDLSQPAWPDRFGRLAASDCKQADALEGQMPIRVLSLFSGAGGLDIGFHDAGFRIVESVELEKKFSDSLALNAQPGKIFEGSSVVCKDIRDYEPNLDDIDFVIGGPPCQTFSAAGRRANGVLGTTDERGVLFREYVRILEKLRPKGFLFENVYGIVGAQNGEAWREILSAFSSIGYELHYRILDAADYGAPQHRERLIIVGLREGSYKFPRPLFGPDSASVRPFYNAGLAIKNAPNGSEDIPNPITGRYANLIPEIPPGLNYSYFTKEMGHSRPIFAWRSKFSDFMYKADPEEPVRTIKAQGGQYTGPFHWDGRHFSVPEYKRLQSFPDDYDLNGTRGVVIHQIGNSVPPQLARILALSIRSQVFDRSIPIALETLEENEELGFRKRKRELTKRYREKAAMSLAQSKDDIGKNRLIASESFSADFNAVNFSFSETKSGKWNVSWERREKELVIELECEGHTTCEIEIRPCGEWSLPFDSVRMTGRGEDESLFAAMWRSFNYFLAKTGLKADLVQLSGYYQYPASFLYEASGNVDSALLKVINVLGSGVACRKTMKAQELSELLGIEESELVLYAKRLRRLGFEVRNTNTNSQIPHGYWLVPYEFPTLTPLSIQLKKEV